MTTELKRGDWCPCLLDRVEVSRRGHDAAYRHSTDPRMAGTGLMPRKDCGRCLGYGLVAHPEADPPPPVGMRLPPAWPLPHTTPADLYRIAQTATGEQLDEMARLYERERLGPGPFGPVEVDASLRARLLTAMGLPPVGMAARDQARHEGTSPALVAARLASTKLPLEVVVDGWVALRVAAPFEGYTPKTEGPYEPGDYVRFVDGGFGIVVREAGVFDGDLELKPGSGVEVVASLPSPAGTIVTPDVVADLHRRATGTFAEAGVDLASGEDRTAIQVTCTIDRGATVEQVAEAIERAVLGELRASGLTWPPIVPREPHPERLTTLAAVQACAEERWREHHPAGTVVVDRATTTYGDGTLLRFDLGPWSAESVHRAGLSAQQVRVAADEAWRIVSNTVAKGWRP